MTDQVTPVTPQPAPVVVETPNKRKFVPNMDTVKKSAKIALMVIGGVTVAKKVNDLSRKEVNIDFNAQVTDPDEQNQDD